MDKFREYIKCLFISKYSLVLLLHEYEFRILKLEKKIKDNEFKIDDCSSRVDWLEFDD